MLGRPPPHPDRDLAPPDRDQGREGRRLSLRIARPAAAALAAWAGCAVAAPLTAEQAAERQHAEVRRAVGTEPCPRGGGAGDIIVCGRRGPDPNRIPFPDQRSEGEPENLLPGELPRAVTSFSTCEFGCQQPVTITDRDVRKYGGRILRHILGKDD
jgi:hypothetical protein